MYKEDGEAGVTSYFAGNLQFQVSFQMKMEKLMLQFTLQSIFNFSLYRFAPLHADSFSCVFQNCLTLEAKLMIWLLPQIYQYIWH
jgi:hypothetical protein